MTTMTARAMTFGGQPPEPPESPRPRFVGAAGAGPASAGRARPGPVPARGPGGGDRLPVRLAAWFEGAHDDRVERLRHPGPHLSRRVHRTPCRLRRGCQPSRGLRARPRRPSRGEHRVKDGGQVTGVPRDLGAVQRLARPRARAAGCRAPRPRPRRRSPEPPGRCDHQVAGVDPAVTDPLVVGRAASASAASCASRTASTGSSGPSASRSSARVRPSTHSLMT